ncbi:Zinc finger, RING/FYVE/PHD-type [Sesbania bispinosa]|nr:Zinc finger, RING/FYVE/PHD-type [Sesbania bispinosa]
MASGAIFSSLRRRRSPTLEAFLAPVDLSDVALIQTLVSVANELVSCFSKCPFFQRKNSRSLIRKVENHSISGHFHDLNQEISTLLDVFPVKDIGLSKDVREQVELLQKQSRRAKLFIDMKDDALRIRFFSFLDEFENGRIPDSAELRSFYVENCGFWMLQVVEMKLMLWRSRLLIMRDDELDLENGGGQTYDRSSISRWMEEGHTTCPKTGQMLAHNRLVPNRALRNLIVQWCAAHGVPLDPPEVMDPMGESFASACPTNAALEANRATAALLIQQLANGSQTGKTIAAREIRLLAKTGKENRAFIAEAGAIPHLRNLLSSPNAVAQENSVTALLNLSIFDKNKSRIMDEEGCLGSIVDVLRFGHTTEARENAAATLFSLSAVHDYKKIIADKTGAVEALAGLLQEGTPRGKKDAVTALFNLSTHTENCVRMIEAGAVSALVGALGNEGVAEEAAGALALIVRQPVGAKAVVSEEEAVAGLIGMMRCGTPRGKENAVAALLELCRSGGAAATERVVKAPALAGLLQTLLFTGTKRARRKAASLARVFQRCENASLHYGGLGVGYAFASNSAQNRDTSFAGDVSVPMSISVPVL